MITVKINVEAGGPNMFDLFDQYPVMDIMTVGDAQITYKAKNHASVGDLDRLTRELRDAGAQPVITHITG